MEKLSLTPDEELVYDSIKSAEGRITQSQIARACPMLGSHKKHENYRSIDTTTRRIREIVRSLIMKHGLFILADNNGYWIARTDEEKKEYMDRFERQARASAKSYMQRYHVMSKNFGLKRDYFEKQGELFDNI